MDTVFDKEKTSLGEKMTSHRPKEEIEIYTKLKTATEGYLCMDLDKESTRYFEGVEAALQELIKLKKEEAKNDDIMMTKDKETRPQSKSEYSKMSSNDLSKLCKELGVKTARKKSDKIYNLENNVKKTGKKKPEPPTGTLVNLSEEDSDEDKAPDVDKAPDEEDSDVDKAPAPDEEDSDVDEDYTHKEKNKVQDEEDSDVDEEDSDVDEEDSDLEEAPDVDTRGAKVPDPEEEIDRLNQEIEEMERIINEKKERVKYLRENFL